MALTVVRSGHAIPNQMQLFLAGKRWAEDCSAAMLREMAGHAPHGTGGKIYRYFDEEAVVDLRSLDGYAIYHGNIAELRINRSAPKNTIAQFLAWYRRARRSGKKSGGKAWPYAWYYLTGQQKKAIAGARSGRRFGGPHPPPTYMEAINSGAVLATLPGGSGAYGKQARFLGFLERVKANTRGQVAAISARVTL